MKTQSKKPLYDTEWDYVNAINIANQKSYLDIDYSDVDIEVSELVASRSKDAEKITIIKDLLMKLSFEAKEVIRILCYAPAEIMQMMTPKTKNITKRKVIEFISSYFFGVRVQNLELIDKRTKRVMDELKDFVSNF